MQRDRRHRLVLGGHKGRVLERDVVAVVVAGQRPPVHHHLPGQPLRDVELDAAAGDFGSEEPGGVDDHVHVVLARGVLRGGEGHGQVVGAVGRLHLVEVGGAGVVV